MAQDETLQKTEELLAKTSALIEQVETKYQETSNLLEKSNIKRDAGKKFLAGDSIPAAEKAKALKELEDWNKEVEEEIARALSQADLGKSSHKAPRKGLLRV